MAAFDFPASPTTGQVFTQNGVTFMWNGYAWIGGGAAAQPTEQFIDISGLTYIDVPVPAWAKAAAFEFSVQIGAISYFCARLSFDGTTFAAGSTDYMNGGPVLNSGTSAYAAFGQSATSVIMLGVQGDNAGMPHQGAGVINVQRPSASAAWAWRCSTRVLDSSAASQWRTWETSGYFNGSNSLLAVKAIRFLRNDALPQVAGSWLRIRWLGDSAQLPTSVGIPDAPSDGKSYARLNAAWSDISMTFATQAQLANYLPLVGGSLTGALAIGTTLSVGGSSSFTGQVTIQPAAPFVARWAYDNTAGGAANVVVSAAGVFNRSTSLRILKTDIHPLDDGVGDAILALKPSSFRMKSAPDGQVFYGFIADELSEADDHFASWGVEPLRNADGTLALDENGDVVLGDEAEPNGVDPVAVIAGLVNMVQRLAKRIAALEGGNP